MKRTNVLTVILALLWSIIIVLGTLSPLAHSEGTSNQFGDMGMWSAIGFILILFILPLYLYNKGSKGAKIALSIIIGIFIIGSVVLIRLVGVFLLKKISISLVLSMICILFYIILSITWYVFSFRKR